MQENLLLEKRAWIGVDPGKQGAAAILFRGGYELHDWNDETAAVRQINDWCRRFDVLGAAVERQQAMPKNGAVSLFNLATNYGFWIGILTALNVPLFLARPQVWQRGQTAKADGQTPKERSLRVARRIWPDAPLNLQKHNGRSDALLIARFAKGVF